MKRISTLLLLATLVAANVLGQSETDIISKANDLVADKKYASAFKVLSDFDSESKKPDIVLLKEDIALNYFVTSIMHQMFAFKDLEKNEEVQNYRGKQGKFDMFKFPINEILDRLIKENPSNYKLYKGLGDYYNDVLLRYQGGWLKKDKELSDLLLKNYQVVIDNKQADFSVFFKVGMEILTQKRYKESIPYFVESIKLKSDNADVHYNMAYAYMYTNDLENALKYAKISYDLYVDKTYKGDAARMIGELYSELKDSKNAIIYYEIANEIEAGNYYNLKPLLSLYVKTGDAKEKVTMNTFFLLEPENPTIYNDLGNIYFENSKSGKLSDFYVSKLSEYEKEPKILGNLHFYLGQTYLSSNKKLAKEHFLKANDIFTTIKEKDNGVFNAIKEGIKIADKK